MLPLPLCIGTLFFAYRLVRFLKQLSFHGYVKGYRPLLDPHSLPGNAIPANWWHMGFMWPWIQRKHAHFNHTYDLTTIIPILAGNSMYIAASVGMARQIWGNEGKTHLVKPSDFTTEAVWGSSIASANGEDWKRHRRVVAPAISSNMLSRVVDESALVYQKMCKDLTPNGVVTDLHSLLLRFTLVMICRCGFGMSVDWKPSTANDEVAIFDRALSIASTTLIHRLIFPNWVWRLPVQRLREIDESWTTVLTLIASLAAGRQVQYSTLKELGDSEITDLFTKLVSSTEEASRYTLTPAEVTGDMMSLLFAGNETTSSALMSTLVFLGLHPDQQQTAYEEILREVPSREEITLRNVSGLKYLLACMHEAHRLVPATINLPRDVPEDIVLRTMLPTEQDIIIRKGSRVMIDIMAVCHNPHDFPAPESFNPARWLSPDLKEDVIMFGAGPRSCVGRRFAQTEAVTFLAHFLRDWQVETVLHAGETHQTALDRILSGASMFGTAFGVGEVPVKITKRD
ncbi:Cytochrome P450 [Mycena indigotica]|uniref:Cytochrome P450 n=1 Tax=Mycena indigotica TaxID=2126181 RepID=A0A8H6S6D9_9AGAR|nr:Cytochrome P450 [Mycena indigotica]KAF7293623.1 Cytochrome P450 [Mycena indigotica]